MPPTQRRGSWLDALAVHHGMFADPYLRDLATTWELARGAGEQDKEVLGLLLEAAVRRAAPGWGEWLLLRLTPQQRRVYCQRVNRRHLGASAMYDEEGFWDTELASVGRGEVGQAVRWLES